MHHVPVLLGESLRFLEPERGGLFVDATLGLGGHAEAILERGPTARLVGIDRDPQALALARERLARFGGRVEIIAGNFADLLQLGLPLGGVAGVLADLGVSSLQIDSPERGFSFRFDGPLDMRMGAGGVSAREIVNDYPEAELVRIFREYGEEHDARRIARVLVRVRTDRAIETTGELKSLISRAKGSAAREGRVDPATRVFQALRIEANQELTALDRFLDDAVRLLDVDGRLVVISYHSLEDRRVKTTFRSLSRGEVDPITGHTLAETQALELLTSKPVRPGPVEVSTNPRSRSALLRAARRTDGLITGRAAG